METKTSLPAMPRTQTSDWYSRLYSLVSQMRRGKFDNIGTIVIKAGTTETEILDTRLTKDSHISFTGLDSSSNSGIIYVKNKDAQSGKCTIGHDSAEVDRNYSYAVVG